MSRWGKFPVNNPSASVFRSSTPARVCVGRVGLRASTDAWLQFRQDHAMARDAVRGDFSENFLDYLHDQKMEVVQSQATDKLNYIGYPPKGKVVDGHYLEHLKNVCPSNLDVQIVICDGLSARAIEDNLQDILPMMMDGFQLENISCGTPVVVKYGRVGVADQISHALQMKLALCLIGERPGLSTPGSMSAYLTYNPGPNTISSDRTVVSNIHQLGTLPIEAGAHIVQIAKRILRLQMSGVRLQQSYTD